MEKEKSRKLPAEIMDLIFKYLYLSSDTNKYKQLLLCKNEIFKIKKCKLIERIFGYRPIQNIKNRIVNNYNYKIVQKNLQITGYFIYEYYDRNKFLVVDSYLIFYGTVLIKKYHDLFKILYYGDDLRNNFTINTCAGERILLFPLNKELL